jgi:hypothetical protein
MKRPSYREAIAWLAANDDTDWVEHHPDTGPGTMAVTASLICDLFDVAATRLRADLTRELEQTRVRATRDGAFGNPPSPVYRGEFYAAGRWAVVENQLGLKVAYMTEDAARAGARLRLKEFLARGQQCANPAA